MTLVAGLPTSTLVTCRLLGSNHSDPASSGAAISASSARTSRCTGLSARCGYAACPCVPVTVMVAFRLPRRPILITSPSASGFVGSPTKHASGTCPCCANHCSTRTVPSVAGPSSSPVINRLTLPHPGAGPDAAAANAAIAPFMSQAPRPISTPSCTAPPHGSSAQPPPGGTTSVCPAKHTCGPAVPRRANRLGVVPYGSRVTVNPCPSSAAASTFCAPPSGAPVTDAQRNNAWANGSGSFIPAAGR